MTEFELGDLGTVDLEKASEALTGVEEIGGHDGEVLEERHFPKGKNGKGGVVEGEFEGPEGREVDRFREGRDGVGRRGRGRGRGGCGGCDRKD
jgi:hypothetical protein